MSKKFKCKCMVAASLCYVVAFCTAHTVLSGSLYSLCTQLSPLLGIDTLFAFIIAGFVGVLVCITMLFIGAVFIRLMVLKSRIND